MMKKCVSSLLAVTMLFLLGSTCVFAEGTAFTPEQLLYGTLQTNGATLTEEEFSAACHAVGKSKDATVYYCGYRETVTAIKSYDYAAELLGDYLFTNEPCFFEDALNNSDVYTLGIYVISGQEVYSLAAAYHKGLVDINEVAAMDFPDQYLHIKKTNEKLNDAEKLILRYFDEFDYCDDVCPLFYFCRDGEIDGYTICEFFYRIIPNITGYHPFYCGDYLMYDSDWYPYGPGIFAIKGNDIHTADEAYDSGIFPTLDAVMEIVKPYNAKYKAGDYDGDKKIGVNDVLSLQKYLAGLIVPSSAAPAPQLIFDFTRDYQINLNDAIAMQKQIAMVS